MSSANIRSAQSLFNPEDVVTAIRTLHEHGDVFELRALGVRLKERPSRLYKAVCGFFNNSDALVSELGRIQRATGIYVTLNPVNPALLSRAINRINEDAVADFSAKDDDIMSRRWFLIDCDPTRPKGVSATDDELEKAKTKAKQIHAFLKERGWGQPVCCLSGNGVHLLYRVDLPTGDDALLQRVLVSLSERFDGDGVDVDRSVYNPSRITKLYGTLACKGDNSEERPHRMSKIVKLPKEIEVVTKEQLEDVAALAVSNGPAQPAVKPSGNRDTATRISGKDSHAFVAEFTAKHGIPVARTEEKDGGTYYMLTCCPWAAEHGGADTPGDSAIIVQSDGTLGFNCFHSHCSNRHWQDLRLLYEPEYERRRTSNTERQDQIGTQTLPTVPTYTLRSLQSYTPRPGHYIAGEGWLRRGAGCLLTGGTGLGKSVLVEQLCVCLAAGIPFLGIRTDRPVKVMYVQAENDAETLKRDLPSLVANVDGRPCPLLVDANLTIHHAYGLSGPLFVAWLEDIVTHRRPDVLVIDPYQAFLGGQDINRSDTFLTFIEPIQRLITSCSCGLLLVAHTTKPRDREGWTASQSVYMAAGSSTISNWCRTSCELTQCNDEDRYRLRFGKNPERTGLVDDNGAVVRAVFIEHSKNRHEPCWKISTVQSKTATSKYRDAVLSTKAEHPNMSLSQIAARAGCSKSMAGKILSQSPHQTPVHRTRTPLKGVYECTAVGTSPVTVQVYDGGRVDDSSLPMTGSMAADVAVVTGCQPSGSLTDSFHRCVVEEDNRHAGSDTSGNACLFDISTDDTFLSEGS